MVPIIFEWEANEANLFLSGSAPSHTSFSQIPTFSTGGKVLYSNIGLIELISGRVLNKSIICVIEEEIFEILVYKIKSLLILKIQ